MSHFLTGFEREYHLINTNMRAIRDLAVQHGIGGIHEEYFLDMLEIITDPFDTPEQALAQLRSRVELLETLGVELGRFSSYATGDKPFSLERVTHWDPYYQWIHEIGCPREGHSDAAVMQHVGCHINLSHPRLTEDEDLLVHATNWLRAMAWLFVMLSANSPHENGQPNGHLSRRVAVYPNRYDVPLWRSAAELRQWIKNQEAARTIYPGKARCWMTCAPRFQGNDWRNPLHLIELRAVESGTNMPWEMLRDCAKLAQRIIQYAFSGAPLPVATPQLMRENDQAAARFGRFASVSWYGQQTAAFAVARDWCFDLPALVEVIQFGSPAEQRKHEPIPPGH